MPKPPSTGYMYYLSDYRSEMMKNNPQLSLGEICNFLGKKWRELPSEQRQVSCCHIYFCLLFCFIISEYHLAKDILVFINLTV